jgi:hypothetical protein
MAASGTKIVLLDSDGVMQTVYELSAEDKQAGLECHEPRPCSRGLASR